MAVTASQTLGVNAAFLQEIKEDHHEIRELLGLVRACTSERRPSIDALTECLERLRDQLAFHFALEEAYGYYDAELSNNAPWLCEKAAVLRKQHVDLFVAINERVNEAEKLKYHEEPARGLAALCQSVDDFCNTFDEHERQETELIFEAFDDDVGVGD